MMSIDTGHLPLLRPRDPRTPQVAQLYPLSFGLKDKSEALGPAFEPHVLPSQRIQGLS